MWFLPKDDDYLIGGKVPEKEVLARAMTRIKRWRQIQYTKEINGLTYIRA